MDLARVGEENSRSFKDLVRVGELQNKPNDVYPIASLLLKNTPTYIVDSSLVLLTFCLEQITPQ